MPEVSAVIPNPFKHGELSVFKRYQVGKSLASRRYDQAIVLPNSFKSALVPFFAQIPKRTGFIGEMRSILLNDARKLDAKRLPKMVERFLDLADDAAAPTLKDLPTASLKTTQEQIAKILSKLGLSIQQPVAAFCPGAEYGPAKRWPPSYYADLAGRLKNKGYAVWIIGSAKDTTIAAEICAIEPHCIDLCGRTALDEVVDLLSVTSVVVSNDSGLMHVAAALDKPLIAIYGSSSPAFTPPLSPRARVLKLDLSCSPCFERVCPLGHFKCMMALTPDLVFAKIIEYID